MILDALRPYLPDTTMARQYTYKPIGTSTLPYSLDFRGRGDGSGCLSGGCDVSRMVGEGGRSKVPWNDPSTFAVRDRQTPLPIKPLRPRRRQVVLVLPPFAPPSPLKLAL
jgi:hypothetical protein